MIAFPGDPLRRPSAFALDEFHGVAGIRWRSWGEAKAVGTGGLSGMWCLPACQEKPYPATITLSGLTWRERVGYYTRFTVWAQGLPADKAGELTDRPLPLPES
ncbi:hypothetical protein [Microtetraspora sp. NBRC 16547]|uniref:hypothetical protein n=1 Tax=Microtetraspora sp. NBRC 16547 TaxID=3030993 RepID=UPI0024A58F15|nr:hypothetical protein [Microtetraspora sp. NBRC 16547]GLX02833.1 hypothetical protein Misp02_69190 [Microtetraspora sp. NBRC 16547]